MHFYIFVGCFMYLTANLAISLAYSESSAAFVPHDLPAEAIILKRLALICFTYLMQVLPVRFYKLSSELKQEALQNRLNIIGYLSHEMRTPLNTAFLGLDYVNAELRIIKQRLAEPSLWYAPMPSARIAHTVTHPPTDLFLSDTELDDMLTTSCHVLDACQIASQTLDDLLTVDKIGDGKLQVSLSRCNPWSLIKKCTGPFTIVAKDKDIDFSCDCRDCCAIVDVEEVEAAHVNWTDEFFVMSDEFKINQVLRNILSNALKFTPREGRVSMNVEILPYDFRRLGEIFSVSEMKFDRVLKVTVHDSGPGISSEDQQRLFGKYVQFNPGQLQKGGGSGLGLWISKSKSLSYR
jgi:signal transduction histidine kinase